FVAIGGDDEAQPGAGGPQLLEQPAQVELAVVRVRRHHRHARAGGEETLALGTGPRPRRGPAAQGGQALGLPNVEAGGASDEACDPDEPAALHGLKAWESRRRSEAARRAGDG